MNLAMFYARKFPFPLVLLILFAVIYVLYGYLLAAIGPQNVSVVGMTYNDILLPTTVPLYPEPLDKFLYVTLTISIPFFLVAIMYVAKKNGGDYFDVRPIFWGLISFITLISIFQGYFFELLRLFSDGAFVGTIICFFLVFAFAQKEYLDAELVNKKLFKYVFIYSSIIIIGQRVWNIKSISYEAGIFGLHYEAVTSSAVRIASGETCLVDVFPQYGCFGEILSPLLQYFGSSIFVVSGLFAVLLVIALAAAMLFTRKLFDKPVILLGCLLSLSVFISLNLIYDNPDPVIQYFPLRFLFPSLSLLLVIWYQRQPGYFKSIGLGVFSALSIVWNLESGLAVTLSLAFFVLFVNFTEHPWREKKKIFSAFRRLLFFILSFGLVLSFFTLYLYLKSAVFPNFQHFIMFHKVFFELGFGMLPIPSFPDYWTIYVAIIFCVLFWAVLWVSSNEERKDHRLELVTYLAVLSIGLFVYYVGRSHDLVLRLVVWPGAILFFFLLDRATQNKFPSNWMNNIATAITILCCTLPAAFLVNATPSVVKNIKTVSYASHAENSKVLQDISFITAHTQPGEEVAIVSVLQGIFYGESDLRSKLEGPGVVEMLQKKDWDDQVTMLINRGPEKLFLGTSLNTAADDSLLASNIKIDLERFKQAYKLIAEGPEGRLLYLQRKANVVKY
jgi:hypothetical protein